MAMTLTSEVALIMLMSWLPVGGTMERIACGHDDAPQRAGARHAEGVGGLDLAACRPRAGRRG